MKRLSAYFNELISLAVMLLLLAALVSGQLNGGTARLAAASDEPAEISNVRLEGE
jgi:hypothetical protein